jgi:hypothetical protein
LVSSVDQRPAAEPPSSVNPRASSSSISPSLMRVVATTLSAARIAIK